MKTIIKKENNVTLTETFLGVLEKGMVRIKVKEVGLCRTDLYVAFGEIKTIDPIILGHEFSGEIVESNSELFRCGDKVSVNPLFDKNFMGLHFDGCLREYIDVPENQVVNVFDLNYKVAAYVEPVAASMAVLKACKDKKSVGAVFGKNRIAELTYIILKSEGYNISWVGQDDLLEEESYDYIVETMFNDEDLIKIINALKKEGLLVIKSRKKTPTGLISSDLIAKEITLKSVNYYDYNLTVQWMMKNEKAFSHLLGESYEIEDWKNAFNTARGGESKKIFIHF